MRAVTGLITVAVVGATLAVSAGARQDPPAKPLGEVLEGKIKQAAFGYYAGMVLAEPDLYLKGVRLPIQSIRSGRVTAMDEAAARKMLQALAAKQAEKPLSKEERTEVVGNIIKTLDEADIRFIGANTANLVFLIRHDPKTKADHLCSLTLHRPDPKAGEWKVIQEVTDAEPVPEAYVK